MVLKDGSKWRVTDVVSSGQGVHAHAAFTALLVSCPKCTSDRRPRRYGEVDSTYRDTPFLGRQVAVTVSVQRFRCHDCGQAFFQELTDMDGKRRMTA